MPTGELQRIGPVAAARAEVAWYRSDLKRVAEEAAIGLKAAARHRDRWIQGELAYWGRRADPALEVAADLAEPLGSNANRSRQYLRARTVDPLDANGRFERYLRARMESDDEGRLVVQALKQQDTSVLSALSSANALIRRLAGTQAAASGEIVDVIALDRS